MSTERTALWLSIFTVAYNLVEGVVAVGFSAVDGSIALFGFGADSFVESLSGAVMIWRFWKPEGGEAREHRAARLVGVSFLILAAYVAYEAIVTLAGTDRIERSLAAVVIAMLSLAVMPTLFILKRRTAERIGSRSLLSDSNQTLACIMLSVALLIGAGLNYWMGIWQADPIAGLLIAAYLGWEGWEAISSGETCAC
jgi:divalent metal cation (Fe/Co/Zn/Cd) transporter